MISTRGENMNLAFNLKFARGHGRVVRQHMAKALIGRAVDLRADPHTIVHGVVTEVLTEAGTPKLVVRGTRYDLGQILTAMPASLDLQLQPPTK